MICHSNSDLVACCFVLINGGKFSSQNELDHAPYFVIEGGDSYSAHWVF